MYTGNGINRTHFWRVLLSRPLAWFIFSLAFMTVLNVISINRKSEAQHLLMESLINEKGNKIRVVVSELLYKTQALASLVIQSSGDIVDFDRVAAVVANDPAILNILAAPGGTVQYVYPLQGNEPLVGYDLLGPGAGNKEAILARERGTLVFGGPFELMQGGVALVGRLPVMLPSPDGGERFWGLVSVTLKYPEALSAAELETLERDGLAFEIWRVNPDDGQRQVIASSGYAYNPDTLYVEKQISILNAEWYFRLLPVRPWHAFVSNWLLLAAGFLVSGLIAFVVNLKSSKDNLAGLLRLDALTGVLNRTGLFGEMKALIEQRQSFRIYYFDLDRFKQINDVFGHSMGDKALIEFCRRMERRMGQGQRLSRISGDEFVLIDSGPEMAPEEESRFWEQLEKDFSLPIAYDEGHPVELSYSKGKAIFPTDGRGADELLRYADDMMYQEKRARYARDRKRRASDLLA